MDRRQGNSGSPAWRKEPGVRGLYVVQSEHLTDDGRVRIRVGAGGNKRGKNGVKSRIQTHGHACPKYPTNNTLSYRRWSPIKVWGLDGWEPSEVTDAEHILYRPFLLRFRRMPGTGLDDSIFIIDDTEDLAPIFSEVDRELYVMSRLRV